MNTNQKQDQRFPAAEVLTKVDFESVDSVHGVTFDGEFVWFAHGGEGTPRRLLAVDPETGEIKKSLDGIKAESGTAFDGEFIWQLGGGEIHKVDREKMEVVASIPAPNETHCSGMAWAEGVLWIGDYQGKGIVKLDPNTGEILKRLDLERLVTGVTWTDGELWCGSYSNGQKEGSAPNCEIHQVDTETGEVVSGVHIADNWLCSGLEADGEGRFWCGGSGEGTIRAIRRP